MIERHFIHPQPLWDRKNRVVLIFNESNIGLLEAVLHDADFYVSDLPSEENKGTLIFNIRRPDWKKQHRTKTFFIKMTYVKEVFSQLILENIYDVVYNWKDDLYSKPTYHHSILGCYFNRQERSLTLDTGYMLATFYFDPIFKVMLSDSMEKIGSKNFLSIVGWNGFDYESWESEYSESKKTVP